MKDTIRTTVVAAAITLAASTLALAQGTQVPAYKCIPIAQGGASGVPNMGGSACPSAQNYVLQREMRAVAAQQQKQMMQQPQTATGQHLQPSG